MNIIKKDAAITNTGPDDAFPGSFEVILSAPTKDRDGDTLLPEDWKTPLPEHITFDTDHGMSVASTVGSGVPELLPDGRMKVNGTYSSLPRAQDARTLVKEGHIRTTSVAFMSEKSEQKDGTTKTVRELLNGAFVAIPSNREALVLSSKALEFKSGARNSASDAKHVQAIHDHALALGADPKGASGEDGADDKPAPKPAPPKKSFLRPNLKAVAGSYEQNQQAVSDALSAVYTGDDVWAYPSATFADSVVYHVSGGPDAGQWQASYVLNSDGTASLGTPSRVNLVQQVIPAKSFTTKDADTDSGSDPIALIQATDAAIDGAIDLFASVDADTLPPAIQQAIALIQAADTAIDELMSVAGIPDPDEDAANSAATDVDAAAAGKSAAAAATKSAAVEDADSDAVLAKAVELKLAQFI